MAVNLIPPPKPGDPADWERYKAAMIAKGRAAQARDREQRSAAARARKGTVAVFATDHADDHADDLGMPTAEESQSMDAALGHITKGRHTLGGEL